MFKYMLNSWKQLLIAGCASVMLFSVYPETALAVAFITGIGLYFIADFFVEKFK